MPATAGTPDVKVHPLVAETIRYQAGTELLASLEVAVKLLAAAISRLDERDPEHADRWLAVLPHLQALQLSEVQLPARAEASLAQAAARYRWPWCRVVGTRQPWTWPSLGWSAGTACPAPTPR